jgi:diaminopimelate epimerase
MQIPFVKYQGTGNDFILIDNRARLYDHLDVALLCHPKFGIGGDGLMLLQNIEGYDFEMVYYNSDGQVSSMCGNGGRCIVDFAKRLNVFPDNNCHFLAVDGPHNAIWNEGMVELQMKNVEQIEKRGNVYILNTGSPHYISFQDQINDFDLLKDAKTIRYSDEFKDAGINVNFVELMSSARIGVRTYERGVENETLSCGTGVTAASIALSKHMEFENGDFNVQVDTPGGHLMVKFHKSENLFSGVWLCGPAKEVFKGTIDQSN